MKKIAVLLATGFEEIEAITVVDVLRRADFSCDFVSMMPEKAVSGSHGIVIQADKLFDETLIDYDMLVLPGGMPGAKHLKDDPRVLDLVRQYAQESSKYLAAICAAPIVLAAADVIKGKRITSFPAAKSDPLFKEANYLDELIVVDDNIITSRGPATSLLFAYTLVEILGRDSTDLREAMLYNMLIDYLGKK